MARRPKDPQFPLRHVMWTDDFTVELPIRKTVEGIGAIEPSTLIDEFCIASKLYNSKPAMSFKKNGKWVPKHTMHRKH
jgi:hypothetical protein